MMFPQNSAYPSISPTIWAGKMILVRFVMAASILQPYSGQVGVGSILRQRGSTSTNTGLASK